MFKFVFLILISDKALLLMVVVAIFPRISPRQPILLLWNNDKKRLSLPDCFAVYYKIKQSNGENSAVLCFGCGCYSKIVIQLTFPVRIPVDGLFSAL
jgi:hypothetical protein